MRPPSVVALTTAFEDAREPPRREGFLAGTERAVQRAGSQAAVTAQRF